MKDEILDYFEERDGSPVKVVIVKYFFLESVARLYAARLREAGIPSFIANANAITAFPLGGGGITLHIRERDLATAQKIVQALDDQGSVPAEEDFRNASLEDIEFQRELKKQEDDPKRAYPFVIIFFIFIILLVILRAIARAMGWVPNFDSF
ncbi:MAG: hypothetical protein AAGH79_02335 [Bacteroidota bacterium]